MVAQLSLAEVSARLGEAVERVREWRAAGLIGGEGDEAFSTLDLQRAWVIQRLLRRGPTLAAIVQAEKAEAFLQGCVELIFRGSNIPTLPLAEALAEVGLGDTALANTLRRSELFPQGALLDEDDLQALRGFKAAMDAGFPTEAMTQLMRVYADALGRVAEAETRLFHFYVHEPLKTQSTSSREVADASAALSGRIVPLAEPAILYFHRRARRQAVLDDAVLHLREEADARVADQPGQLRTAVVFADLSSFTSLADAMGDHAAAAVLERFSAVVRDATARHDGRVVKQIGDAFMLVFSEARHAVICALEIDRQASAEAQFPAVRSGIHAGSVLYREGDYVGATVNLAARLAAAAARHQVLVTRTVRDALSEVPSILFEELGNWRFKGLSEEVEVFAATSATAVESPVRLVDPVCGMELDAAAVVARLALEGREEVFCSQACLQRFVLSPERYRVPARP